MPIGQVSRQRAPERRLVERRDRTARENAGIAIGGFAAGLAPIDKDDRQAPLPRRQACGYADDARAQHDDIRLDICLDARLNIRLLARHAIRHRPPALWQLLHQRQAAIDRQQGSRHMSCLRRQQKGHHRGHLIWLG